MKMILKRNWHALDASKPRKEDHVIIPMGEHEIERIPNPRGYPGFWLVLKSTLIGASEGFWRQWEVGNPKPPALGSWIILSLRLLSSSKITHPLDSENVVRGIFYWRAIVYFPGRRNKPSSRRA